MPGMTKAGYTPPSEKRMPSEQKKPERNSKKKKKRKRVNPAAIASLAVFAAAFAIGAGTLHVFSQVEQAADIFAPGQLMGGQMIGGMTAQEGAALLDELTDETVNAWRFEIACQDRTYALTAEDIGLFIDKQATLEPLWQVGKTGNMLERYVQLLRARAEHINVEPVFGYAIEPVDALLEQMKADTDREPVDATVRYRPGSSEPFRFTDEQIGYELDTAELRAQIEQSIQALKPGSAVAVPRERRPAVLRVTLEDAITLRARVRLTLDADAAALENARIAAGVLDGLRMDAGDTLSFNEAVGRRTAEGGYQSAPEPAYGIGAAGIGGGVCQVSTALYQAALLGDVTVVSRSAAIRPVAYCEMGQEAVVSDQGIDLVLENPTNTPLYLTTRIYAADDKTQVLEVQIIGAPLDVRYALVSSPLETEIIEEPVYMQDKTGDYATYTDERVPGSEALPGYSSVVERVKLGENGEIVSSQIISEDVYEPIAPIIYVGMIERE